MNWDLDTILRAAGAGRDRPCLVELGRSIENGRATSAGYLWSTGRVYATVATRAVRIERRLGVVAKGIELTPDQLESLSAACADWAAHRERWAAFWESSSGYPPGMGSGTYYRAPGPHSRRVTIGSRSLGSREGASLRGHDDLVPLATPRALAATAQVMAEIWRRGEAHGPARGALVGQRYRLAAGALLDAQRMEARLWRPTAGEVYLEPGEEAFVAALCAVLRARARA